MKKCIKLVAFILSTFPVLVSYADTVTSTYNNGNVVLGSSLPGTKIALVPTSLSGAGLSKPKPHKACQVWSFTSVGSETGTWNFTEGFNPGTMEGHGSSIFLGVTASYALTATVTPLHKVFVERRDTSSYQACNYTGLQVGNQISGTYICLENGGTPVAWSAVVSQC